MRYTRIKLVGFAGIMNGLNLDEIEIDLNKCQHNILLLVGDTGSGKSTIMNALNPMPDDNSKFIPRVPACKEIDIDNTYFIKIFYNVKGNGNRDTPKIYFHKINGNGELVDLNPNLNVNSYKEVLYNELGLDANYLALSRLGQRCSSIVSMTPSERKKFINSIITELTDYNDIYKTLSKRSSIFKSFINNTTTKISSIGDKEYLTNTLIGIEERLNRAMNTKDLIIEELAKYKSIIQVNDPDGSIQESYNSLYNSLMDLNTQKKEISSNIVQVCKQFDFDLKDLSGLHSKLQQDMSNLNTELKVLENSNNTLLSTRDNQYKELQKHQAEILSYQSEYNSEQLENEINQLRIECDRYESIMKNDNIQDRGYTIESLNSISNILNDISVSLKNIREVHSLDIIQSVDDNMYYIDYDKEISNITQRLSTITNEITRYNTLIDISKVLDKRPNECNIDSCPFISNAVNALAEKPLENIALLEQERQELNIKLQSLYADKQKSVNIIRCKTDIDICNRMISNYKSQLDSVHINIDIKDCLMKGYFLENEFNLIDRYTEECNILLLYSNSKVKLDRFELQYQQLQSKQDMIHYIEKSIQSLTEELQHIDITISDNNNKIIKSRTELQSKTELIHQVESVLIYKQQYDGIVNNINDINSRLFTLQSSMQVIQQHISLIEQTNVRLEEINKEIKPLIEDRDTIKHSLKLLDEYLCELDMYNSKYAKVELLKKHCSPTKGIALAFMSLYLNSTLNIANTLMDIVFEGEYSLLPFNIDENEFKIPCIGGSLPHDDVSSTSGGQESIISMILSFSILHQSATKFNIFQLDEVDAPLDTNNRRRFIQVINTMIDKLGLEQVIMISHNREIPYNYVDTIILKTSDNFNEGNVVYKYE